MKGKERIKEIKKSVERICNNEKGRTKEREKRKKIKTEKKNESKIRKKKVRKKNNKL